MLESFSKIAPYLSDPLALVGFFLFIVFLTIRVLFKSGIFPKIAKTAGAQLLKEILLYGFLVGLLIIGFAFHYKHRELELTHSNSNISEKSVDIAKEISVHRKVFSTSYIAKEPPDSNFGTVNVSIEYPQITGHPNKNVERKINDFIIGWAGVNIDHQQQNFDHVADFEIISLELNTLVITMEDSGVFAGATTGATINKNLVLNLLNGEVFELKDLFRAGHEQHLLELVKQRAFCDKERTRPADETGPIRADQEYFLSHGNLVLVYQRREICSGADGPTFVTIEGQTLKPILNPNGPLGYLL